ncbi:MAG TPA: hypothetical protein VFZ67_00720, partial [Nitrososphaera sp.]
TVYESEEDGFRLQVPQGWVIEDDDNTNPELLDIEEGLGFIFLAMLCLEVEALPGVGGTFQCEPESLSQDVGIARFKDLQSRPEFATLVRENRTITSADLIPLHIDMVEVFGGHNFRTGNITDTIVNVIDPQTNQTVGATGAKLVELTYQTGTITINDNNMIALLALNNNTDTGYSVFHTFDPMKPMSPQVQQIFDTFELVEQQP